MFGCATELVATPGNLDRTRLNLAFYPPLKDFVPIWDAYFSKNLEQGSVVIIPRSRTKEKEKITYC